MQSNSALQKMHSSSQLASAIGYSYQQLITMVFGTSDNLKYDSIITTKRDGQVRIIDAPSLRLKAMQRRVLPLLDEMFTPHSRANAYIKGRGLRKNALPHVGKRFVFNIDLKNFFGNINFGRVRGRLLAAPYGLTDDLATTIARLCTCNNRLPFGAPTSPILSNMICHSLDYTLTKLAKRHGCFYTRYADDITFSTNRRSFPAVLGYSDVDDDGVVHLAGPELVQAITDQGFTINAAKTRLLSKAESQEVCGIICNERLNVRRDLRRELRGVLHAWKKFGYDETEAIWKQKHNWREAKSMDAAVRGKLQFLIDIKGPNDAAVYRYVEQYNSLRLHKRAIAYELVSEWRSELTKTSCCIHSYQLKSVDGMIQGSGFVIEDGYIVTNDHVVHTGKPDTYDVIEVSFPGYIKIQISAEVVFRKPDIDLAVLRITDSDWEKVIRTNFVELANLDAEKGDSVTLTGWPNYNEGDDLHEVDGYVLGNSFPNKVKMFRIVPSIVFGNSGGPVYNEAGQVVGVATRGSDVADAPLNVHNGCITLTDLKTFVEDFRASLTEQDLPKVSADLSAS